MRRACLLVVIGLVIALQVCFDGRPYAAPPDDKYGAVKNFDMPGYLAGLSFEAKKRGFKEFTYKSTPQGELRLYVLTPDGWTAKDRRAGMVFFSGGGWTGTNVFSCAKVAEHFAKLGVVVALPDYRVRKRHGVKPDKCAEDARSAVRWLRAHGEEIGVDPGRVIAGGGSAGGHIAGCTAIADAPNSDTDDLRVSCIPNGLLLYYPVASLVDGGRTNGFKQVLGADLAVKLSPARHVTNTWPPTVLLTGSADIELANAVLMHDKAREAGANFEMYVVEGGGHGVAPTGPREFTWLQCAGDFFVRAGLIDKGPPAALPKEWRKYTGGPIEKLFEKPDGRATRPPE
jgi:acetyl esterase